MKLPVEISKIIEISDPVYTFCEIVTHIDLSKYLANEEREKGRPRYDEYVLFRVVLFAFMEFGYVSTRAIEKLCKTDIRFMWLLDGMKAPSHMTIDNFINRRLVGSIEEIFKEINGYIFEKEHVDTNHVYIDGTKIRANANMYSWVWKKSCVKNRIKTFEKITELLNIVNENLRIYGVKLGTRTEYAIEYLEELLEKYVELTGISPKTVLRGRGHRKTVEQKHYDLLTQYVEKLKKYAEKINICGEERNSYSKSDNDATFMRMNKDYMKNDQLLPGYNVQLGICDEYIAVFDVMRYASDMDCFAPLMKRFALLYGRYPEYPVADAGYGSFNNYLFCEEHGMKKYMKFTMFEKASKDEAYMADPFRAVNFPIDGSGHPVCPNGRRFMFERCAAIKGNKYGRTEEYYKCESCDGCQYRSVCCKGDGDRMIRLNRELTSIHQEVLNNLNSTHGALLRMNRSIQAEGAYGTIKWNRAYTRARRRGLKAMFFEIGIICVGFNMHKYHIKKQIALKAA